MATKLKFENNAQNDIDVFRKMIESEEYYLALKLYHSSKFSQSFEFKLELAFLFSQFEAYHQCIEVCLDLLCQKEDAFICQFLLSSCFFSLGNEVAGSNFLQDAIEASEDFFKNETQELFEHEHILDFLKEKFESLEPEDVNPVKRRILENGTRMMIENDFFRAEAYFEKSDALDDESIRTQYLRCLLELSKIDKIRDFCKERLAQKTDAKLLAELVFASLSVSDFKEVENCLVHLEQNVKHYNFNEKTTIFSAFRFSLDDELIKRACTIFLKENPFSSAILLHLAIAHCNQKNYKQAIECLEKVIFIGDKYNFASFLKSKMSVSRPQKFNYETFISPKEIEKLGDRTCGLFFNEENALEAFEILFVCNNFSFLGAPLINYLQLRRNDKFVNNVLLDAEIKYDEKLDLLEALFLTKNQKEKYIFLDNTFFSIDFDYPQIFDSIDESFKFIYAIGATIVTIYFNEYLGVLAKSFDSFYHEIKNEKITYLQYKYYTAILLLKSNIPDLNTIDKLNEILELNKTTLKKYMKKYFKT